jgi:hypothetical protein
VHFTKNKPPFQSRKELETFYDLTFCLASDLAAGRITEEQLPDTRARVDLLVSWAQDFNREHTRTVWGKEGKDYLDTLDEYYVQRLSDYLTPLNPPG